MIKSKFQYFEDRMTQRLYENKKCDYECEKCDYIGDCEYTDLKNCSACGIVHKKELGEYCSVKCANEA
jgi:hypothetical protein